MSKKTESIVAELVRPFAEKMGVDLVDVEFRKEGPEWVLYVYIDKTGGVTIDDCEALSRVIDPVLDESDPIETSYCLCVSSPGLDRPFKTEADYKRAIGQEVEIKLFAPLDKDIPNITAFSDANKKCFVGVLSEADSGYIVLKKGDKTLEVPKEKISLARIHIKF